LDIFQKNAKNPIIAAYFKNFLIFLNIFELKKHPINIKQLNIFQVFANFLISNNNSTSVFQNLIKMLEKYINLLYNANINYILKENA